MKRRIAEFGMSLIWTGLAFLALIAYFSQIAAKMEINQAIIGLLFFLVAILDIQITDISFKRISCNANASKITRKMILVVSILLPIAGLSFILGWASLPSGMPPGPRHLGHHGQNWEHGQWLSFLLHTMTNLATFKY